MINKSVFTVLLCLSIAVGAATPNQGSVNPNVTQANISKTICVAGWTKTIRPPEAYTNSLKKRQMQALGLTGSPADYEEDHIVNLGVGGHPTDPKNLRPQLWAGDDNAKMKDRLETTLQKLVCNHTITLKTAQKAMMTDWHVAYKKYVTLK